jgi:galactitol-specific phosphotransferase system IIB component
MEGIFCSLLPFPACLSEHSEVTAVSAAAINCSIVIRNRTKTVLTPGKIPLYTEELAVYETGGKLVSSTLVINMLENNHNMSIVPKQGTPLVPAVKCNEDFFQQGTRIIKNITGF